MNTKKLFPKLTPALKEAVLSAPRFDARILPGPVVIVTGLGFTFHDLRKGQIVDYKLYDHGFYFALRSDQTEISFLENHQEFSVTLHGENMLTITITPGDELYQDFGEPPIRVYKRDRIYHLVFQPASMGEGVGDTFFMDLLIRGETWR